MRRSKFVKQNSSVFMLAMMLVIVTSSTLPGVNLDHRLSFDGNILYVGGDGPGNYSSIQSAITAASPGDTIFVYNGTYFEHVVVNKPSLTLRGEDANTTIIDGSGTGTVLQIYQSPTTLSGFRVCGGGHGGWDHGITVSDETHVYISNCIVTGDGGGIRFNSVSDSSITDCIIYNNTATSISVFETTDNVTIRNCIIHHNGGNNYDGCVMLDGTGEQCSNISISRCTIYENFDGIVVLESNHVTLSENTIYNITMYGIVISATGGPVNDVLVQNNTISHCSNAGILVQGVTNALTIIHNTLRSMNNFGLRCTWSSGNTIAENTIQGGNMFFYLSSYNTITQNVLMNSSRSGIDLYDSDGNIITENTVLNHSQSGIVLALSSSTIVSMNTVQGNKGDGIKLDGGTNITISMNTVMENQGNGIYIYATDNTITENTVKGNNGAGIEMSGDGSDNIISKNMIMQNQGDGIYFYGWNNNNTISENTIRDNTPYGIDTYYYAMDNHFYHNLFINNTINAHDEQTNTWDNGYPSGGNYWDDYTGSDIDGDGIGDTPYPIPGGGNQDRYPLIGCLLTVDAHGPYTGWVNQPVQFHGSASGGIPPYQWSWDFGDGNTSTSQNPTHNYSTPGVYNVTLTVIDNTDQHTQASDNTTATIQIAPELIADADGPYESTLGEPIQFQGSATGGIPPYQWSWDFGDGNTSSIQNPVYTYALTGIFNVTLTVIDNSTTPQTAMDTTSATITGPALKINDVNGGFGKVNATIENTGTITVTNATWTIIVKGGLFGRINIQTTGTIIEFAAGDTETIKTDRFIFGLGTVSIVVTAEYTEPWKGTGFVLGPFVLRVKEM